MHRVILAYPVTSLSVARYLAAAEIEYLGFDTESMDENVAIAYIKEMVEWIHGPAIYVKDSRDKLIKQLLEAQYVQGSISQESDAVIKLSGHIERFIKYDPFRNLNEFVWLQPDRETQLGLYDSDSLDRMLIELGREI